MFTGLRPAYEIFLVEYSLLFFAVQISVNWLWDYGASANKHFIPLWPRNSVKAFICFLGTVYSTLAIGLLHKDTSDTVWWTKLEDSLKVSGLWTEDIPVCAFFSAWNISIEISLLQRWRRMSKYYSPHRRIMVVLMCFVGPLVEENIIAVRWIRFTCSAWGGSYIWDGFLIFWLYIIVIRKGWLSLSLLLWRIS